MKMLALNARIPKKKHHAIIVNDDMADRSIVQSKRGFNPTIHRVIVQDELILQLQIPDQQVRIDQTRVHTHLGVMDHARVRVPILLAEMAKDPVVRMPHAEMEHAVHVLTRHVAMDHEPVRDLIPLVEIAHVQVADMKDVRRKETRARMLLAEMELDLIHDPMHLAQMVNDPVVHTLRAETVLVAPARIHPAETDQDVMQEMENDHQADLVAPIDHEPMVLDSDQEIPMIHEVATHEHRRTDHDPIDLVIPRDRRDHVRKVQASNPAEKILHAEILEVLADPPMVQLDLDQQFGRESSRKKREVIRVEINHEMALLDRPAILSKHNL